MTVHYHALWMMPDFMKQKVKMTRHKPSLNAVIDRKLDALTQDCSGLDRKAIKRKDRKIFRTKIDDEMRMIDEPLDSRYPSEVAVLYLDHHDPALRFAESYDSDTHSSLRRAARYEPGATYKSADDRSAELLAPTTSPARSSNKETYGEYLKVKHLRRLELTEEQVIAVRASCTSEKLIGLGLSDEVIATIEHRYIQLLPGTPLAPPVPAYDEPLPLRVTREQLPAFGRASMHKYLAVMTPRQKELAQRASNRLYIIRGAAGSGKTVIGVRRIEHLLEQRDMFDKRAILFTCYNRSLRHAIQQMVEGVLTQDLAAARVEVKTIYQLLIDVARERGLPKLPKLAGEDELLPLIATARERVAEAGGLGRWSDQDLYSEIREVIFGRALTNRESYLNADRLGRSTGKGLDKRAGSGVWKIYEEFRALCATKNVTLWEHRLAQVAQSLASEPLPEPRYAGVVIDEAQDLMPAAIQCLVGLQAGNTDNMLILGDAAQNVYHSGFRWKHCGVSAAGGQFKTLRECFRSTPAIVAAATPLIAGHDRLLEEDLVLPESVEQGQAPPVVISLFEDDKDEALSVAVRVGDLVEQGVPMSAIGVLCDDRYFRKQLAECLVDVECEVEELYKVDGTKSIDFHIPSVKLLTTYSAKGLEFEYVFVPQITERQFPTIERTDDESGKSRRALYTAMMRCGWQLHLSAPKESAAALLSEVTVE